MSADGTTADRCRFKDLCIDATDQHRAGDLLADPEGNEFCVFPPR